MNHRPEYLNSKNIGDYMIRQFENGSIIIAKRTEDKFFESLFKPVNHPEFDTFEEAVDHVNALISEERMNSFPSL